MARRLLTTCSALFLSLQAVADDFPFKGYATQPFNPPDIAIQKSGVTDPGYIFIGPRGNVWPGTAALIYDDDGNLVWQGPQQITANFKVQKLFNQDVITYWAGDMMDLGYGYGAVHILDNTYREIYTVKLQDDSLLTPDNLPRDSYIDLHESHVTDRNTLLITAYNITQHDLTSVGGGADSFMLDSLFYEIDIATNEIIHSWSAFAHPEEFPITSSRQGYGEEVGAQTRPWDAFHINSVELMPEGYMISLRHFWSGFYIHNNGSVLWQISGENGHGDFTLDDGAFWSWQHDIRIYNQTEEGLVLSLFNNANTPTETSVPTSGLSLYVDLVTRQVSTLRDVQNPYDEIRSMTQGSYQLIDPVTSHVFLGYGSMARVKEFDGDNKEVLTAQFGDDNTSCSYRAYKCKWKATPYWKPSVLARKISTTTQIFVSWNGATEYDYVAVYSVPSEDYTEKTLMGTHERTGFETRLELESDAPFVVVVCLKGDIPLSTSDPVPVQPDQTGTDPYSQSS
ncbi:hypothetical protein AWENTII_011433 [Aspergillus wentii]|nr:hypothetical protein MW887_003898 [Aspergillus wentii]